MARIFSKRNIRKYREISGKLQYKSFSVSPEGKITLWFEIGSICLGLTVEELEKVLGEAQFMNGIVKRVASSL